MYNYDLTISLKILFLVMDYTEFKVATPPSTSQKIFLVRLRP